MVRTEREDETDLFRKRSLPAQSRFHQAANRFCFGILPNIGGYPKNSSRDYGRSWHAARFVPTMGFFFECLLQDARRMLMERGVT